LLAVEGENIIYLNIPHIYTYISVNIIFKNHYRLTVIRKAEVLNSLIINTTAKANDTTDILQTFR